MILGISHNYCCQLKNDPKILATHQIKTRQRARILGNTRRQGRPLQLSGRAVINRLFESAPLANEEMTVKQSASCLQRARCATKFKHQPQQNNAPPPPCDNCKFASFSMLNSRASLTDNSSH